MSMYVLIDHNLSSWTYGLLVGPSHTVGQGVEVSILLVTVRRNPARLTLALILVVTHLGDTQ